MFDRRYGVSSDKSTCSLARFILAAFFGVVVGGFFGLAGLLVHLTSDGVGTGFPWYIHAAAMIVGVAASRVISGPIEDGGHG